LGLQNASTSSFLSTSNRLSDDLPRLRRGIALLLLSTSSHGTTVADHAFHAPSWRGYEDNAFNELTMSTPSLDLMRRILFGALPIVMFILVTCKHDGSSEMLLDDIQLAPKSNHDRIIIVDNLDSSKVAFDPAGIDTTSVQGDVLRLKVSHAGGCEPHDFTLYGLSGFLESSPPQAEIFLAHDAHGDMCEARLTKELRIDLTPLREVFQRAYGEHGMLLLRIHAPGALEPVRPLRVYNF
jgi:hypothetical protein